MIRTFQETSILIILLFWLINLTGCIPETALENIVVTEDVIYVSGERVRFTGRLIEANGNVDEHGFYIAKDENFTAPITILLGPKTNGLGRFIGEYDLLEINTTYYFRSFANINGNEVTGQIKEFASLKPRIEYFSPKDGVEDNILTITGTNFTHDTRVLIGGIEADIIAIKNETSIEAKVPAIGDTSEVTVTVEVQDTTMVFASPFTYHFGRWQLETTFFNNLQLYETMWLKDGNNFVFGLGDEDNFDLNLDVWSLDLTTYTWTDLNFPGTSGSRSPFYAGNYWGAGAESERFSMTQLSPFFWQYSSGNFVLKPFLTFRLYKSVGLELNGDLYVFGGLLFDFSASNMVYRYQELTSSWETIGEAPIDIISDYPYFATNSEAYFLQPDGSIWRFNTVSGEWGQASSFPDVVGELGMAVTMNNKAYIGLFSNGTRVWEWDINNNLWVEKSAFPGSFRDVNNAFFSHNNKLFFFRAKAGGGKFEPNPLMELWSLDPAQLK
jgi:IPT/TIG domain